MHPGEKYDVVFIGKVLPKVCDSNIAGLLKSDYVFLFTTMLNQDKDSPTYGDVHVDLVRHDALSHFESHFRKCTSFHNLKNESLRINDFLEIIPKETENGIQIIAHLKNQKLMGKDHRTVRMISDFSVLLLRENNGEHYDNYPVLELGPEFQANMDVAEANRRYYELRNTSLRLTIIGHGNEKNLELINAIEVVQAALNKDRDDARLINVRRLNVI